MRLFILLLMQIFVFMPLAGFAADGGISPLVQEQKTTEPTAAQKAGVIKSYGKLPLYFIENRGQVDKKVSFYERGAGHATFFTRDGVVLALTKRDGKPEEPSFKKDILGLETEKSIKTISEAVSLSFVDAKKEARISAGEKMAGKVNYFVGNDRSKWRSNIPTYGAVRYKEVYKNIDVKFYGNNRRLEHDVIVHPGGDPSMVKFAYRGIKGLKVREDGDLEVSLAHGNIIERRPVIYQEIKGERVAIEGSYRLIKGEDGPFEYGFTVASYDHTKDLVIDPVLVYSTYLGGTADDPGWDIAVDASGSAYVTGDTSSTDFPLMNPIQGVLGGFRDAFITKLNPAGTALVYSTYLGGTGDEEGRGIVVDASGSAYVTGYTSSTDFPLMNPIQGAHGGGTQDAFITKLNPAGTALAYSTYLGGGGSDFGYGIAVDASGSAYVAGDTSSTDFPLLNPIQGVFGGFEDAFVTKLNPAGTALVYSTYLGGTLNDYSNGIAVDASGSAYVVGDTWSTDFPLLNPMQGAYGGGPLDAFITKLNPAGTALAYSTYLGGTSTDSGNGIAVDASGSAYVTGHTWSTDFPLLNPIQGTHGGGSTDAFITKLNPAGTALAYSTYLGGTGNDFGKGIAVDASGSAYVTGATSSIDFPLLNPIQGASKGSGDAFITKLNPAGAALAYSTYLGGSFSEIGQGIAVDAWGGAYVAGNTRSTDFPLLNPIQGAYGGGIYDAFITKISVPVIDLVINPDVVSIARGSTLGYTVTATNTTGVQQCFNYWENVNLPGGALFPTSGELLGPVRLCLNAGASRTAHLAHGVPMSAPVGAYVFNGYVGAYAFPELPVIVDEAHFNFDVTAFGPLTNHPETSWRLLENGLKE